MQVGIDKVKCGHCSEIFYEINGYELSECPHCRMSLDSVDDVTIVGNRNAEIEIDPKSGKLRTVGW